MKILDATAVIAFLSELLCPEILEELSKYYKLMIPEGVFAEIKKPPGKEMLNTLVKKRTIQIVKVDQNKAAQLLKEHPQLHLGECEAIAFAMSHNSTSKIYILSDDSKARKIFQNFSFSWTEQLFDIMKGKGMIKSEVYDVKMKQLQNSPFYSRSRRV